MDVLGVVLLVAAFLPLWVLARDVMRLRDPNYWRKVGVIVKRLEALDGVAEVIGRYMGSDIYGTITFKGIRYDFDRVAPQVYKRYMHGAELFLEPGLVYVAAGGRLR
jgi:hypothetical protein